MQKRKINSIEFMLILCHCSCEQKKKIEKILVDLLLSEIEHAECIVKRHINIHQLKEICCD